MTSPAPDVDDQQSSHSSPDSVQPQMTMHPIAYPGMPMHMYPFPTSLVPSQPHRTKRRQVKNACTNCQKACKKCDDARPCLRCVKYGIAEECMDSQRKERKKGIKRGPYKKRDGKSNNSPDEADSPRSSVVPMPPTMAMPQAQMQYIGPMPFHPGFYSQYTPGAPKPGEGPAYFPQLYFAPMAPPPHMTGQDGENPVYPSSHPQFYPATILTPYGQPYGPYMMPHPRLDGQVPLSGAQYAAYPTIYPKPPSASGGGPGSDSSSGRDGRVESGKSGGSLQGSDARTG